MNLIPRSIEELELTKARLNRSKNEAVIEEFKKMGVDAVEIQGYTQKDAFGCANSFRTTCKRMNCGVTAITIDGKPYLVKLGVI